MIFAFENGKVAKIDLKSYETKTNRKKLANAYSDVSTLIYISHILEDIELVAFSSLDKVLVFDTSKINAKSTRNSQGVQVLRSKNGSTMTNICTLEDTNIKDFDYYRTKNIPAVGYYLREEDEEDTQLKLLE